MKNSKTMTLEQARAQFIKDSGGAPEEISGVIPFHLWEDTEYNGISATGIPFIRCQFIEMDKITIKGKEKDVPLVKENGELKHLSTHYDLVSKCEKLSAGDEVFIELTDEIKDTGNVNPMKVFNVLRLPKKNKA